MKDYETKAKGCKLEVNNDNGGNNSKLFWNLIRQIKRSNSEDLHTIKNQKGEKIFNEKQIKQYTKKERNTQRKKCFKNIFNMPQVFD